MFLWKCNKIWNKATLLSRLFRFFSCAAFHTYIFLSHLLCIETQKKKVLIFMQKIQESVTIKLITICLSWSQISRGVKKASTSEKELRDRILFLCSVKKFLIKRTKKVPLRVRGSTTRTIIKNNETNKIKHHRMWGKYPGFW